MTQKTIDWIAAKIEASRPGASDARVVTDLVDTVATLRGLKSGQCFGLQVPKEVLAAPGAAVLAARGIEVLEEWAPHLSLAQHDMLGELLVRTGIRHAGLPMAPSPPPAVARLLVDVPATIQRFDPETEDHEDVHDPAVIARFDGVRASQGLDDLPCVVRATGGDDSWCLGGGAALVYDPATGLRCRLTFEAARVPNAKEVASALKMVEQELFFTGWGLNLEWAIEDADLCDMHASVRSNVLAHRLA